MHYFCYMLIHRALAPLIQNIQQYNFLDTNDITNFTKTHLKSNIQSIKGKMRAWGLTLHT